MATRCAPPKQGEEFTTFNLNKLRQLFDGKKIKDVDGKERFIGEAITKHYGFSDAEGRKMFEEIVWRGTYKPAIDSFTGFKEADFRRVANEIQREAKNLNNPKLNVLERFAFVKRGVMSKWAITNWMNRELNNATNYEQTQFSHYLSAHIDLSKYLRTEILKRTGRSRLIPGIKEVRDLEKLENRLLTELHNPKSDAQIKKVNDIRQEIIKVFESEGGQVLEELRRYLETTPTKIGTDKFGNDIHQVIDDMTGKEFSYNVRRAGELSRGVLERMGTVLIRGLEQHKTVIRQSYLNDKSNKALLTRTGKLVKRYEEKINDEVKNIVDGLKKGNYFPHYLLESFVKIEGIMNRAEKDGYKNPEKDFKELESVFSNMRSKLGEPLSARFRRGVPFENYMKNPLSVLRKYSMDAIAFNKSNYIRSVYMDGIQKLPKDSRVAEGLRDYLDDMFTVAEKGYQDRPVWVNKTVRALTGFEFLSKIGFGVGTAARNTFSGFYFLQGAGNNSFISYLRDWSSEGNRNIRKIVSEIEEEQGFKFADMSAPIYTEGFLPTEGVKVRDIDLRPDADGNVVLQWKDGKVWRAFDSALTSAAGKGAIFQKITENFLRKHMWRYSLMTKINEMMEGGLSESEAIKIAKPYALDIVNKYAFAYAPHQKAPIIGGTAKPLGSFGQIAFQFMHFPMSFLQLQSEILRKSKDAAIAKQWDSPDMYVPLKFAGLYFFTHMMSGVANLDFHRLMENDTVERIKDLKGFMEGKEDIKGRGYIGPAVGDLFFLATMYDFIKMPDTRLKDLIVGYNDAYALTDEQKQQRLLSTLNVQLSKIVLRDAKALQNGTGWNVLMHEFGLYPRAWTRELRKGPILKPFFPEQQKNGRKKEKTPAQLQAEVNAQKEKELTKLYRAMGV